MSTKYTLRIILIVFLRLLDSQLCNSIDLRKNFLFSVNIQTMKKCAANSETQVLQKHPRLRLICTIVSLFYI